MSDLETLTQDLRSAVRAAAPLIEGVGKDSRALTQQLGNENGPALTALGQQADQALKSPEGAQVGVLRGAMHDADVFGGRLRRAGGEIGRFQQDLDLAGNHLREGAKSQAKLVEELGVETPEIKTLGNRLTDLSGAVKAAGTALDGAGRQIDDVRDSVNKLLRSDLGADRAETADRIRAAQTGMRQGADELKATLGKAAAKLAEKEPDRLAAMDETDALAKAGEDGSLAKAADLAKTADAARNPTPKDQEVAPGSASRAGGRAHNPASPTQERGL
ncbi:hypothetical protein [Kribbella sp. DT2]|uniref:hypothetical protein n=1 Tax=Kribbella sp. DT2 TaxID=3393427 RepID=UPI003CF04B87